MENKEYLFDLFDHDDSFKSVMKSLFEDFLNELFESVMITKAAKGYPIVYVNPAFVKLTGYQPDEVIGKSPSFLQGADTDKKVIQRLDEDIRAGRMFFGQAINYRKDGSKFMMEWKIVSVKDQKGQISHYLAFQRDVSINN